MSPSAYSTWRHPRICQARCLRDMGAPSPWVMSSDEWNCTPGRIRAKASCKHTVRLHQMLSRQYAPAPRLKPCPERGFEESVCRWVKRRSWRAQHIVHNRRHCGRCGMVSRNCLQVQMLTLGTYPIRTTRGFCFRSTADSPVAGQHAQGTTTYFSPLKMSLKPFNFSPSARDCCYAWNSIA